MPVNQTGSSTFLCHIPWYILFSVFLNERGQRFRCEIDRIVFDLNAFDLASFHPAVQCGLTDAEPVGGIGRFQKQGWILGHGCSFVVDAP